MARPKKEKSVASPAAPQAESSAAPQGKVNKSQAVREYMAQNPGDGPKQISAALQAQGLDVSPSYVSIVKFQMRQSAAKSQSKSAAKAAAKRAKVEAEAMPEAEQKPARGKKSAGGELSLETLIQAKKIADSLGGVAAAREALAALSRLID